MRINKFIALATGMSRRTADRAIEQGRVRINNQVALIGQEVTSADRVAIDTRVITPAVKTMTVMLNKPVGYVCSRRGQGSRTIYDLLPPELHHLKPVGRLDKYSSGLLLLTNDGNLAHELTHPSFQKNKLYEVKLDKPLSEEAFGSITGQGVRLDDGYSSFQLTPSDGDNQQACYFLPSTTAWRAQLAEGRNRQIRRTFAALGFKVVRLHRTNFGKYSIGILSSGKYLVV